MVKLSWKFPRLRCCAPRENRASSWYNERSDNALANGAAFARVINNGGACGIGEGAGILRQPMREIGSEALYVSETVRANDEQEK